MVHWIAVELGESKTCFPKGESSSKDVLTDQGGTDKVSVSAVHHQYFEVATCFLKDIISESAKVKFLKHCLFLCLVLSLLPFFFTHTWNVWRVKMQVFQIWFCSDLALSIFLERFSMTFTANGKWQKVGSCVS